MADEPQRPSIGRIVHFFDENVAAAFGVRVGPYAAMVTSLPDADANPMFVNLSRIVGHDEAHSSTEDQLSVPFGGDANGALGAGSASWWCWPPRT